MARTRPDNVQTQPMPEVLDMSFDVIGVNNVTNDFDAIPQDCPVLDNIINTKPGSAEIRPGMLSKINLSTFSEVFGSYTGAGVETFSSRDVTDLVPITMNFQDFSIPKSNDPTSADWWHYKTVRIWVIQVDRSTVGNKRNLEFIAVAQDIESGVFDSPVQITLDMYNTGTSTGIRVLGSYGSSLHPSGASMLAGFPVKGFSAGRDVVVSNVAECEISGEAADDGTPYIVIAAGDFADSRSLLFQFIDRTNPHGSFGSDATYGNERYWYFSPEQYATRELNTSKLVTGTDFTVAPVTGSWSGQSVLNLPNGTYTFAWFGVERSGEHVGIIGEEQSYSLSNISGTDPIVALTANLYQDLSIADTARFRNFDAFMLGVKFNIGSFTPFIPEDYRTDGYRWTHANSAYRQKIDEDREAMIREQLATYNKLASVAWNDYYALYGGICKVNAQRYTSGNTYSTGAGFDPNRFSMWRGYVYTDNSDPVHQKIIPVNSIVKLDTGVTVNAGVFQTLEAVYLPNSSITPGTASTFIPQGGGVVYTNANANWYIDCFSNAVPNIPSTTPVLCDIGMGWGQYLFPGFMPYQTSYQLWNLAQQVDFSRKFDDLRQRNAAPRYRHRSYMQQTAFVCNTINEQAGEPLWDSNNQTPVTQVVHPMKYDNRIYRTTPDAVTGVMRRHYFLSFYQSKANAQNIKPIQIQNSQDYQSVYSNALVVMGTNGTEVLDFVIDTTTGLKDLKTRNFHDNICITNQYGVEVFNNQVFAIDKNGMAWRFDGANDPYCCTYDIENDIKAMAYTTDELRYGSLRRCYIDNKPFLVYAVLKGLTYSSPSPTPATKVNYNSNIGIAMPSLSGRLASLDYFWLYNLEKATARNHAGWTRGYARSNQTTGFTSNILPVMTSNTTPSPYIASAKHLGSSFTETGSAYQMFDGSITTSWILTQTGADSPFPIIAEIDLGAGNETACTKYGLSGLVNAGGGATMTWKLQGSNDDVVFTDLDTQTAALNVTITSYTFANLTKYRYYRLYVSAYSATFATLRIREFQLFQYNQTLPALHLAWMFSPQYANKRLYFFNEQQIMALDETQLYDTITTTGTSHYTIYGEIDPNYLRPADPRKLNLFKLAKWALLYGDYTSDMVWISLYNEAGETTGVYPVTTRSDGSANYVRFAPLFGNRALEPRITVQVNGSSLVLRNLSILTNVIGRRPGT